MEETIRLLKGHSGCTVRLIRSGEQYFVRKTAGHTGYNERLKRQAAKQRSFANLIRVPHVRQEGWQEDLYFFDMEYVVGYNFANHALNASVVEVSNTLGKVCEVLRQCSGQSNGAIAADLFQRKIESVRDAAVRSPFAESRAEPLAAFFDWLAAQDWSGIPESPAHGDFTLENMLVAPNGELVLIDWLDSEIESFWLDAGKLVHDLQGGWSMREWLWSGENSSEVKILAMISKFLLGELVEELETIDAAMVPRLKQIGAFQVARILPYVAEETVFDRLIGGAVKSVASAANPS